MAEADGASLTTRAPEDAGAEPVDDVCDPPTPELAPIEPVAAASVPPWRGEFRFTPFEVGDPGRAATVQSYPDPDNWDQRDTVLDGLLLDGLADVPPMVLRAASTRGRAHRYSGKVRQDAYAFRCDGRYVVASVTDGMSTRPLSHVAANIVSQHGCHLIAKLLETTPPGALDWAHILRVLSAKVINAGRRRLQGVAGSAVELDAAEVARELATTALFAVVEMCPVDENRPVHILAYGDTSAWVLRSGDRWEPQNAIKNEGAMIASSATDALPYLPERPPGVVRTLLGPDDALLLITDGVGDPLDDGTGSVGVFLAEKWRRPPDPLEFAAHVDFARRTHDDDRTAVALWPGAAGGRRGQ